MVLFVWLVFYFWWGFFVFVSLLTSVQEQNAGWVFWLVVFCLVGFDPRDVLCVL